MTTLLIMTVGQTDIQLVVDGQRRKLDGSTCGTLHDKLENRKYTIVNSSESNKDFKEKSPLDSLPEGDLSLCTPKLDSVLRFFGESVPTNALVFDTRRTFRSDPRLAGIIVEEKLKSLGVEVRRHTYLNGEEKFDDRDKPEDAVVRRSVVDDLSKVIDNEIAKRQFTKVVLATVGGPQPVTDVINELVRLHTVGLAEVTALDTPENSAIAMEEKFHPAAGYRARWHALSLVEKGNLLGAWGAVSHLERAPGQDWTKVINWLAQFAASLPLPTDCHLAVLSHQRMAVRSALRVELALRAGDIPRAVHGTVAFFEAALWDRLREKTTAHGTKRRLFLLNPKPAAELVRERDTTKLTGMSKSKQDEDKKKPFIFKETDEHGDWYWIDDNEVCAVRLAEHYLRSGTLKLLGQAVNKIRDLRNDVAHNEPTPSLMDDARRQMREATLWSSSDTFLSQPLVQGVLQELGESDPGKLLEKLLAEIRRQLTIEPTAQSNAS